jgi:hypothetical protein
MCNLWHNLQLAEGGQNLVEVEENKLMIWFDLIWFIVFNATFSNISAISGRPVLVVEEAGVPGWINENSDEF